jgi:methionyl-tRNA formyltransferase
MSLKILFMGTPEFAVPILKSINDSDHKILAVYTQPPSKRSRGQRIIESPIHTLSKNFNYNIRCPKNLESKDELKYIKELSPDVVVVAAYGQIIPEKFLNVLNILFLNVHASLLPRWRGAAPIQRSIMEMDDETGITIMKIIPKLDSGPYILQEKITINKNENQEQLSFKLSVVGAKLIMEALDKIELEDLRFIEQDEKKASYAKKIDKKESKINWNIPAKNLISKINGLSPFPGAWFAHNKNRIKIIEAIETNQNGKIGEVIDENLTIGCMKNSIRVIKIQKEGKKALSIKEFLLGHEIKKGEILN